MDALTALRTVNELSNLLEAVSRAGSDAEWEINRYWARDLGYDAERQIERLQDSIDDVVGKFELVQAQLDDIAALLTVLRPIWEAVNPNLRDSAWVWDELARAAREL
jgi:hypothetical protein